MPAAWAQLTPWGRARLAEGPGDRRNKNEQGSSSDASADPALRTPCPRGCAQARCVWPHGDCQEAQLMTGGYPEFSDYEAGQLPVEMYPVKSFFP